MLAARIRGCFQRAGLFWSDRSLPPVTHFLCDFVNWVRPLDTVEEGWIVCVAGVGLWEDGAAVGSPECAVDCSGVDGPGGSHTLLQRAKQCPSDAGLRFARLDPAPPLAQNWGQGRFQPGDGHIPPHPLEQEMVEVNLHKLDLTGMLCPLNQWHCCLQSPSRHPASFINALYCELLTLACLPHPQSSVSTSSACCVSTCLHSC